jgi:hypothetical protein
MADKSKNTYKHYHIYIQIQNMFPKVGLLEEIKGVEKEKENDRDWMIFKYIPSV